MRYNELIELLPNTIELEVKGLTLNELNKVMTKEAVRSADQYDPTNTFRLSVIELGFTITKLFRCYYSDWEFDRWSCTATKDDSDYKITTNHGSLEIVKLEEAS